MGALHLTAANFDTEVTQSAIPVMVDFWAEWCGPCRMIAPIIDEISTDLAGKMKIAKVNVDEAQDVAAKFGIMSIPTMIVFKGGKPVDTIVGAMSKDQLLSKLKKHIA